MKIVWNYSALFSSSIRALSLSTKQDLLILKRTSVAHSQKNKSWCVSCNLISNKTSNKTSCTTFNIRLKYLEMIINVISKISYKKNTLTWYRSFKQNFFNNLIINNLIHKRIMKRIYNNTIDFIVNSMLGFPLVALLLLKYVLNVVAKILKAIRATVQVSAEYVLKLEKELVKALSVEE